MKALALSISVIFSLLNLSYCAPKLSIISPYQLTSQLNEDGVPFSLGMYGKVPYGAHFVGGLALANPIDGCSQIKNFLAGEIELGQNIIAIVTKGGCQNSVKTKNAQLAGAKMVIIVQDDENEPLAPVFGVGSDRLISIADLIHIPTIMISKDQGDKIIKFVQKLPYPPLNPEDIIPIANVNFPYDPISDRVKLDFWLTSSDASAYKFINEFATYVAEAGPAFDFTPHYVTWDCYMCKQLDYQVQGINDCLSGGRYCAPDPDDEGPLVGKDTVLEDLRQICLWKHYPTLWWNYVNLFSNQCLTSSNGQDCGPSVLNKIASVEERNSIEYCVTKSFFKSEGQYGDINVDLDDNKILAEEKELQLEYDITEFPVLLINHKIFSEELSQTSSILGTICKNLKNSNGICRPKNTGGIEFESKTVNHTGEIGVTLTVLAMLLICALVIVFFFRRIQKRKLAAEISLEASSIVSRYLPIKDTIQKTNDEETAN